MIQNPIPWPNGARCACVVSFDMDADSLIHIARPDDAHDRLYPISMGRYGPNVAIPRILGLGPSKNCVCVCVYECVCKYVWMRA